MLDGSGFVRRSRVFAGNVAKAATLAGILDGLGAPPGALVVMDRGIASEDRLRWLRANGFHHLVAGRGRREPPDPDASVRVETGLAPLSMTLKHCGNGGCYPQRPVEGGLPGFGARRPADAGRTAVGAPEGGGDAPLALGDTAERAPAGVVADLAQAGLGTLTPVLTVSDDA